MNKKVIHLVSLVLSVIVCSSSHADDFSTLRAMQQYAQEKPEYPKADNDNWLKPDYHSFYTQNYRYSWPGRALLKLGLKEQPAWGAQSFKQLVTDLTGLREQEGYAGRYVMHITPKPGDRFVIWGDVEGAFHSLVRDLTELERRGIINDNLEIARPEFYFVFNGNVVNRSPYILETLTIVLQLMKKNPYKVFYIRGSGEDRENWYNFGTKDELKVKAHYVSNEAIPLDTELKRFFNTLPLALYLIGEQTAKEVKVVRISNAASFTGEIDEEMLGDFFEVSDKDHPATYKLFDRKPSDKKVVVVAVIKAEDRSWRYTQTQGLVRLGFEGTSVAWSLLSAPTSAYRNLYDFFWDAFAILRVKDTLSAWTLSLYHQDVRDQVGFSKGANFQLTTGFEITKKPNVDRYRDEVEVLQKKLDELQLELKGYAHSCPIEAPEEKEDQQVVPDQAALAQQYEATRVPLLQNPKDASFAVRDRKIILGITSDLKKGLRAYSYAMHAGSQLVFDKVNNDGGFRDKRFELISLNDDYEPSVARKNVKRLLEEVGTDIIFTPVGSATTLSYIDLIQEGKVLVLFPRSGAPELRAPDMPYIINFQVSSFKEGQILAQYAVEKKHCRQFGILYQNDAYGIPPRDGVLKELKRLGIAEEGILQLPYDRNNVNLAEQAKQLQKKGPEALFFLSTPAFAKSLVSYLGAGFFANKKNFAISPVSTKEFTSFMRREGLSVIFTSQTPSPDHSELPIVKQFREQAKDQGVELDVPPLEGYIAAELFMYLLNRIPQNQIITKEAIINAATSVSNQDYKGLMLNYNPETNSLNSTVWLHTRDGDDWKAIDVNKENL